MQGVGLVNRCGTALNVVNVGILINDDQGAFELTHVLGVDAEVSLQRNVHVDTLWHVDERSTGPDSGVQCGELVVACWNDGAEVLLEDLRVLLQCGIGVKEDYSLFLQVLADLVVDNLRLVLSCNTCNEALLLGLRNTQLVVGILDVFWEILPGLCLLLSGADEVFNVVEVNA